jgi:hypothetical protein
MLLLCAFGVNLPSNSHPAFSSVFHIPMMHVFLLRHKYAATSLPRDHSLIGEINVVRSKFVIIRIVMRKQS